MATTADELEDPDLDDVDEPDDAVDDAQRQANATAARHRLVRSRDRWKERAAVAEAERDALQQRVAGFETQQATIEQLRQSLLPAAIRAHAATRVIPEAIDDVVRLVDVAGAVQDDGRVDDARVKAAIDELLRTRPHMALRASTYIPGAAPRALPGGHYVGPTWGPHMVVNDRIREAAARGR